MQEKQEEKIVDDATLAAVNGFINNPFIAASIKMYDICGEWLDVFGVRYTADGKLVAVLESGIEREIDRTYMLGLQLI